ncbi:hypothetical protein [Xanthomonas phage RTH11]|nr:hypothetical protein [Xanthomonas phage RTH11]
MKIGIIGLRPRQISDMQKRKLQGDFVYYNEKYLSAAASLSFTRDKDLVFVQNSGMPKTSIQAIPRGENTYFNVNQGGSISSLLTIMEEAFAERGLELYEKEATAPEAAEEPKRKAEPATAKAQAVANGKPKRDKMVVNATLGDLLVEALARKGKDQQLSSVVPEGRTTEYTAPVAELYVYDGSTTANVEARLARASIGEITRFSYTPQADTFSARLVTVRNLVEYLNRKHLVDIEAHLYDEFVDFQVMTPFETLLPKQEEPAPVETVTEAPVQEKPAVALPVDEVVEQSIASDVPEGRRSQYLLPKTDIDINYPNSGGVQNYSILQAALPGDVVRFARPEHLSLSLWRSRITSMRHYQWRHKGILLEAHFYNEYVDIKVMHIDESQIPTNTDNWTLKERAEPINESRDMGERESFLVTEEGLPAERVGAEMEFDDLIDTTDEDKLRREFDAVMSDPKVAQQIGTEINNAGMVVLEDADSIDPSHHQALLGLTVVPNPDAEIEALGEAGNIAEQQQPVVPESPKFLDATKGEKKFWRIIFLAEFDITGDIDVATAKADAAMAVHKARFG